MVAERGLINNASIVRTRREYLKRTPLASHIVARATIARERNIVASAGAAYREGFILHVELPLLRIDVFEGHDRIEFEVVAYARRVVKLLCAA